MNFRNRKTTLLLPLLLLGLFGIFNDSGVFARDEGSGGLLPFFKRNSEKKNRAEQLFERGREAERKQDWVTASAAYRQCFDEYNDKTPPEIRGAALHRLAVSKARLRQYDESERLFREALPLVGENAEFACDFGQMFYDQGHYVDCEEVLTSARKFANDDPRLNYRLGYAIAMQKDRQIEGARYLKRSLGEAEGFEELAKIFDGMNEEAKADLARQKAKDVRTRQAPQAGAPVVQNPVPQNFTPQNPIAQSPITPNFADQNPMAQNPFPKSGSFPAQGSPSQSTQNPALAQGPQSPQSQQGPYSVQAVIPQGAPLVSSPEIPSANRPSTLPNHAPPNHSAENIASNENAVLPRRYSPLSQGVTVSPSPQPETAVPTSPSPSDFPFSEIAQDINSQSETPSDAKFPKPSKEPKDFAKENILPQISHLAEVSTIPTSSPPGQPSDAVSPEIAKAFTSTDAVPGHVSETSATPIIIAPTITTTLPLPKDAASNEQAISSELAAKSDVAVPAFPEDTPLSAPIDSATVEDMFPLMTTSNPGSTPASFPELPPSPFAEPISVSKNAVSESSFAKVSVEEIPKQTETIPELAESQKLAENLVAPVSPEKNPSSSAPAIAFQPTLQTTIPIGSNGSPQNLHHNAQTTRNAQTANSVQNEQNIAGQVLTSGVSELLPGPSTDSAKPYAPYEHPGVRDETASGRNAASQDRNPLRSGQIASQEPRKNGTALRDNSPTTPGEAFEETVPFASLPNPANRETPQAAQGPTFSPDANLPANVVSNHARGEHAERRVERSSPGASGESALSFATSDTRFTEESPARTSTASLAWNLPSDARSNESRDTLVKDRPSASGNERFANTVQSVSSQSEMPESRTGDPLVQLPKFEPVRDPALPQSTTDSLSRPTSPYPSVVSRKQTEPYCQESSRQNAPVPPSPNDSRLGASRNAPLREQTDTTSASSLIQTDLTRNNQALAQNRRAPTPGRVSQETPLPTLPSAPQPTSASSDRSRHSGSVATLAPEEGTRFQGPARNTTVFATDLRSNEVKPKAARHSWHDIPTEFDEPVQTPTDNDLMQPMLLAGQETSGASRVPQAPGPEGIAPDPLLAARSQAIPVEPEPKPILREAFPVLPTPSTLAAHPGDETDKPSPSLTENEPAANGLAARESTTGKQATGEAAARKSTADEPTVSEPTTILTENTPETPTAETAIAEVKVDVPSTSTPASASGNSGLHIPTELAGVTPVERKSRTNDAGADPTETKRPDKLVKSESETLQAQSSTRAPQPSSLFEPQGAPSAHASEQASVASHSPTRAHALTYTLTPTHQPTETPTHSPTSAEPRTESPLLALAPTQEMTASTQIDKVRQPGGTETNTSSQAFFRPPNRNSETAPGEERREIPMSNESRLPVLLWDSHQLADASDDDRHQNSDISGMSDMRRTSTARTEPAPAPLTQVVPTPSQSVATSSTRNPQTTASSHLPVLIPKESEKSETETLATTGPAPKPAPRQELSKNADNRPQVRDTMPAPVSTPAPFVAKTPPTRQMPEKQTPEMQTARAPGRSLEPAAPSQRKAPTPEPAETLADSRKNVQELPEKVEAREDTPPTIVVPSMQSLAVDSHAPANTVKSDKPSPPKRMNAEALDPAATSVAVKPPVSKPLLHVSESERTSRTDELLFPKLAKAPIPQATDKEDDSGKVRIRPLGALDMSQAGFSSTARWDSGNELGETEGLSAREAVLDNAGDEDSGRLFPRRRLLRNLVSSRNNESVGRDAIAYNAFEPNGASNSKNNVSNNTSGNATNSKGNTPTNTSGSGTSGGNVPGRPDDSASKRSVEYRTEKRAATQSSVKSEATGNPKLAARNTAETAPGDVAVRQNGAQRFAPSAEQPRTVGAPRLSGFKLNPVYTDAETNGNSGVPETKNKAASVTETLPP